MRHSAVSLLLTLLAMLVPVAAYARKEKDKEENSDKEIIAKVWFKNGDVYEGKLPKHWRTRRQTYLNPGHNFHTVDPTDSSKTIKHETKDTDSILIISSTHPDFNAGDFYIAYNGEGRGALHKMMLRMENGRHAYICKLPYWSNCTSGHMQLDQLLESWYLCFRKEKPDIYYFYQIALQNGCNKTRSDIKHLCKSLKKSGMEGLAEAITAKFYPDKATGKESNKAIRENPGILLEFVDNYIDTNGI